MIQVKGNDISISYRDTFDLIFNIVGFEIEETDRIIFTIKDELFDEAPIIREEFTGLSGTSINIVVSSEEMKKLKLGTNYYDLLCVKNDNKVTLNFPAKLIVEKVVHNE